MSRESHLQANAVAHTGEPHSGINEKGGNKWKLPIDRLYSIRKSNFYEAHFLINGIVSKRRNKMKTLFCIMFLTSFCFAKDTLVFSGVIKDGQDNVDGMRTPNFVTVSPDNKNAYVTSSADDALVVFNRDTAANNCR